MCPAPGPAPLPPVPAAPSPHDIKPVYFSRYLRKQNLAEVSTSLSRPPTRPHADHSTPQTRLDVPRLSDLPPIEQASVEVRLRVIYRIEVPLRAGRVIDVLV